MSQPSNPNAPTLEKVLDVQHYTDSLFRFRVTRPQAFRFRSGEFIMLGLPNDKGKPILRAYSISSPSWDEELEFFSIKVPDGPLTSRLQKITVGDEIMLGRKPTGTLVLDALKPGKRLYMLSTGTGFAPFASLLFESDVYEKFESVIAFHGTRTVGELAYSKQVVDAVQSHELLGPMAEGKLRYVPATTRETSSQMGRVTTLIETGELFKGLDLPPFDPTIDRVMICGSMDMIRDTKALVAAAGLQEGSNAQPADFVTEKAFAG